ncbi:MAG: methyltransferase [Desulfuromonadaceae bacterium]|nr:methyltransferase [Desulfuromonadaceae bacterium]
MKATEWTMPDLLQMSGGYWSTCALHAAVKLDFFSVLDGVARAAAEVAQLRHTDARATGMLLDALSALGLLEKRGNLYVATLFAAGCLSKTSPGYLGHIIMHHHHLMSGWARLDEAVTTGRTVRESVSHDDDETVRESFLMGMFNLASLLAPGVARSVDLSECRTLLDLGGGPGTYAIHFCIANPQLTAVVYDLPTTRPFAERTIARFDLAPRIGFTSGNYHTDPLPTGFDAVWVSHVLHSDGYDACTALLRKAAASINPGGILMVQEFILDDAKDGPQFPALFSLNMLLGTENGQAYSEQELVAMVTEAGLSDVQRLELDLPNGAGIIQGRKA